MITIKRFIAIVIAAMLAGSLLSGCASRPGCIAPVYNQVTAPNILDPWNALVKANEYLKKNAYETKRNPNPVFNTIVTKPIEIGYLRWRENNEKWLVTYQVGIQIFRASNDEIYWHLSYHIEGTRSGWQPRVFSAKDFEETEDIFFELEREISKLFSSTL